MKQTWRFFLQMVSREIKIQQRQSKGLWNTVLLFVMMMAFFPLTFPAGSLLLKQVFPGMIWIVLLFLFVIASDALFQQEIESGVLEQWLIGVYPVHWILRAKLLVLWLFQMALVIMVCPLLMVMFHLSIQEFWALLLSIVFGTPTLLMLNALASSFSSGVKQKGIFVALIVLPLSLPVMIFGSAVLLHAIQGFPIYGELALLFAMSILSVFFLPWVMVEALRATA